MSIRKGTVIALGHQHVVVVSYVAEIEVDSDGGARSANLGGAISYEMHLRSGVIMYEVRTAKRWRNYRSGVEPTLSN